MSVGVGVWVCGCRSVHGVGAGVCVGVCVSGWVWVSGCGSVCVGGWVGAGVCVGVLCEWVDAGVCVCVCVSVWVVWSVQEVCSVSVGHF